MHILLSVRAPSAPEPPPHPFLSQGISVAATGNWHRPVAPQVVIQVVVPPRCISSSNISKVQPKRFGLAPAFPFALPLQRPWWALLRQHQQQRQAPSAKSCQHHQGGQLEGFWDYTYRRYNLGTRRLCKPSGTSSSGSSSTTSRGRAANDDISGDHDTDRSHGQV